MSIRRSQSKLNPIILEEATSWFIDFNEGEVDALGREEFNTWLRRSPEHVGAYLQISAFWEGVRGLKDRGKPDMDALLTRARSEQNIHSLGLEREPHSFSPKVARRFKPLIPALAAALLLAIGVGIAIRHAIYQTTYAAAVSEQRSITLEDGSSVELNSRSRLKVAYTDTQRSVYLLEGQALFRVAKNPSRPFIVHSGSTRVRAVGTEFDVYKKVRDTVITVIEGRVAVTSGTKPQVQSPVDSMSRQEHMSAESAPPNDRKALIRTRDEVLLSAGEQLVITSSSVAAPKPANVAAATAWTDKKLIFESTPLHEVLEEFNRYNRQQLVIDDADLRGFHISGVFPSTDSTRLIEVLRQRFGVITTSKDDRIEISRPAK